MNFAQKKAARESIEGVGTVVPDGLELPAESVEGVLADIEHDTRAIDQNDADADVLSEDGDETDAQLDAIEEADDASGEGADDEKMEAEEDMPDAAAEALDVAQESIRNRWGFEHRQSVARESYGSRNRRQVGRESLWDDIKAFLTRIWEWLKEQGRKVKDRWLKFSNVGKSVQNRAKAFGEAIKKLGKQKKDTVSGGFIKQLSIGKTFVGDNVSVLNNTLSEITDRQQAQSDILAQGAALVSQLESAADPEKATTENIKSLMKAVRGKEGKGEEEILGGNVLVREVAGSGDDQTVSISIVSSEATVESEVKTPGSATLASVNTFYAKLGVAIEKQVQAYHANDKKQKAYEDGVEKLIKTVDGVKIDDKPGLARAVRLVRKALSTANSGLSTYERAINAVQKNLVGGLNGYIHAGITAHEKSK